LDSVIEFWHNWRVPESRTPLPQPVADLVDVVAAMPGTIAVVLGGSRAFGSSDAGSDWDLGLYYRSTIDLTALGAHGVVYPPQARGDA
jgi:hypothetical protein